MMPANVADLEKLAVKRDRGYLVRLIVMLALGVIASAFLWQGLTSDRVGGCLADTMVGSEPAPPQPTPAPPE
jgi:hypothetical protein